MAKAKKVPSGSWRVQVFDRFEDVRDKNGKPVLDDKGKLKKKRIYKSFTNDDPTPKGKRDVEREAAIWAASKENESNTHAELTLGEATDLYISQRSAVLSPSTVREYKNSRKRDLQGLMNVKLQDITQDMIQATINQEALSHSPKSVRNMHGILTAVLATYRPGFAVRTKLPAKVRPDLYVPSDADIKKLLAYAKGTDMELPILLAAFGPMRRSEICALESDYIDGNVVHVAYALVQNDKKEWVKKSPKSYAGDRYIPYPSFVSDMFKEKSGRVVDMTPMQITKKFSRLLKRAGLPHFRFHDLRHYSASIQHAIGIPDAYIMQRGGWGNDGVLKQVYRHTMISQEKDMSQKANDYFENIAK